MIFALCGTPLLAGTLLLLAAHLPASRLSAGHLLAGHRADRVAPVAGVATALLVLGLAVTVAVTRPVARFALLPGRPGGLAVDALSAVLALTVASVLLAVLLHAAGERYGARFTGLMLVFAGAMLVTVTASDLVLLLMGWEVMGAMSYALIGYRWRDADRVRAADLAFLTTRAADVGLYVAAGFALAGTRSLGLGDLAAAGSPWRDLVAAGVVLAAMGKSAQPPFSFWLSKAMAGPSQVSALLHSATMVAAGAYLLLRLNPLLDATGWADTFVAWAGALTALVLGGVALVQDDLKQLLAASTCAQLGFMMLGAGAGTVVGGASLLVAHAAVKSLLFLCAGSWLTALGTQRLAGLEGAARRRRLTGLTFSAGALALAGLPPLSIWITKDTVLVAAGERSSALFAVALAASALSAAYAARALRIVWRPASAVGRGTGAGALEWLPLTALAVAACVLGAVPWRRVLDAPPAAPGAGGPDVRGLAVSGLLAILVIVIAWTRPRVPQPGWALGWLYLQRAAEAGVVRPVFGLARALAWFDDHVVDGAVRGAARGGLRTARLAARGVELRVDGLVGAVAHATRALAALARRPQTGQLHMYLAQAAVVLAVLVAVAVLAG
ncbi:NADH-quinone oxidoreductase subunit L [Actinomadura graeca]|uniref:NADH-quinone oxidoreductase subunit L n=1 Tax=Actinomadura graeca TaxID=2750812 RepID=A0ABX8R4E0_9ACTN|nr:proton-conducting transporter membrane subunit [Actinomadura graeca]QXJ24832.1 NADH-quinone oxidoreductase subunit L [Actinomadura graeca]